MSDTPPEEVAPPPPRSSRDLATVGDVNRAAAGEKFVTWISSGLGALATLAGICLILMTGAWVVVDRAEAKGGEAGKAEAVSVKKELDEHKLHEAEHHSWTEKMLLRSDDKLSAVLDGQRVRNPWPEPPPAPPPPLYPDGGLR